MNTLIEQLRLEDEKEFEKRLALYRERELPEIRDELEKLLISLSQKYDETPLSLKDVKSLQDPVFKYWEEQNCGESLQVCITEQCQETHPHCFANKMKKQIRRLQELISPYLKNSLLKKQEPSRRKVKILVIDDDVFQLKLLKYKLVKDDYQVTTALNALDGLKLLEKEAFDLIVCDLMMPGMDGFLFLQKIKANEKTRNIPFIFLTAMKDDQNIVKGLELGADDYLTKPFSPSELSARIKLVLKKRKPH